ncbi:MAG: hypothetical protein UY40_C0009G0016 [candidate division CPR1 bacterium GW2011_GWC1_49_13]|uniref:Uncharacterized protein n=1 Tax=candidate division CPR1 bacterium GW2011_GWC1_49_13 TaxID=1618342 RepID=A0A0G1VGT0_9BACT|nr:MAG: hypothetical protein UY40_C0009G0016 [candidate division CPR1 bacterium GW2011_GWC1_49_13]
MVGEGGIEPPASRTPCERSTGDLLPETFLLYLAFSVPVARILVSFHNSTKKGVEHGKEDYPVGKANHFL